MKGDERDWSGHPTKVHTYFNLKRSQNYLLFGYSNQCRMFCGMSYASMDCRKLTFMCKKPHTNQLYNSRTNTTSLAGAHL